VAVQEVVSHVYYNSVRFAYSGEILRRTGARNPQPANGYYHCQDGQVFISLFQSHQWDRLVELLDDPVLADPAYRDRDYRQAHAEEIETRLQQFAGRFDRWSLTEALQRRGLPAAPLLTVADLAANPHLTARQFFHNFAQPPAAQLRGPGPLFRSSAAPLRVWRPAPPPGTHPAPPDGQVGWGNSGPRRTPPTDQARRLPLHGIRILDLSRVWAGPYGTRYLADHGAEVIKVESGKFPDGRRPNDPAFVEINRNKHSITLNFQLPAGRDLLMRLVASSDVVVENFSPRVMAKYELDYPHLQAARPDLIMVSMPGFGQSGPHSQYVSYGGPLMAYTGMAFLWGHPQSRLEAHSKIAYPDYIAAGTLALAVTAALHHRARTGQGQYIEIAQVEATATAMEVAYLDYFANGVNATPAGNRDPNCAPQGCYPCLGHDAWCVISCATEEQWRTLAGLISGPALADDPQYATGAARWQHHDALDTLISAWTRQHTPHQVMHILQHAGVAAAAVQSGEDLWRDMHLRARNHFVTLEHPSFGTVEHPALTVRLHTTPGRIQRPAAEMGASNDWVFRTVLGLSQDQYARLTAAGVIA
jgi:crotonobetainyl-CoA:carnitine CoA-transferase CaiB-like acyl-CoA transferase